MILKACVSSTNGNIFQITGPLWGESTGYRSQRPATPSADVFFDLHLNKRLSKQSRRQWFETPSRSLWRHCNVAVFVAVRQFSTHTLLCHITAAIKEYTRFDDIHVILITGTRRNQSNHVVSQFILFIFCIVHLSVSVGYTIVFWGLFYKQR